MQLKIKIQFCIKTTLRYRDVMCVLSEIRKSKSTHRVLLFLSFKIP